MQDTVYPLINFLQTSNYDYLSLAQSPAEADMLRYLALSELGLLNSTYKLRLCEMKEVWDFYTSIHDLDYKLSSKDITFITKKFTELKFANELSLTISEKNLAPYHPLLNNLPPLICKDHHIDFTQAKCLGVSQAQPYLNLKYEYVVSKKAMIQQIDYLNQIKDKNQHLNEFVTVKRIQEHPHFPKLNGQRGVFAKHDIPAGTLIDYYSGEYRTSPDLMPPMLCSWSVQKSNSWIGYKYKTRKIKSYGGWTDAFILGNMMKLVNSCYSSNTLISEIGNIGCYYAHLKTKDYYLSLPFYMTIKDISQGSELLAHYHVGPYRSQSVYGVV